MSQKKRSGRRATWIVVAVVIVAVAAAAVVLRSRSGKADDLGPTVTVEQGDVIEKALAVGSIVPRNEISVKSKVSGVVSRVFREPGERVRAGEPLLEIRPDPTPLELAQAKRQIEMDEINLRTAEKTLDRSRELLQRKLIPDNEYERALQIFEQAELQLKISGEHLALIEKGSISIAGNRIESIIKAPICGFVLEKNVNIGDPVVPLTSYQEGTVLMTLADMDSLVFKGTVDEIDVVKVDLRMPVQIKVGALPDTRVPGTLERISLKAREENNSRMFPVEISIDDTGVAFLRAGYSANADIIIREARGVLTLPERVVWYAGDSTWVEVPGPDGDRKRVMIEVGLSDAITVEVKSGLDSGQTVLEKPKQEI
ncbi:MAG: efflux RND transporter periplasmic adaptor subunit [Candidatus Krumholzibacteriota bacterium]|nr:efflux RND transporter periplasmic adaptor subunit [Candidatus Krumholzibacteriota bacterium]